MSSSTGWFDLPFELREMIIDKMDGRTRCVFTKCSQLCEIEAKASKKYLVTVDMFMSSDDHVLALIYGEFMYTNIAKLIFRQRKKNKTTVYMKKGYRWVWKRTEFGTPISVMVKYAKEYIQNYKHSIKEFRIQGIAPTFYDLKSLNLDKVKQLEMVWFNLNATNCYKTSALDELISLNKLVHVKTVLMKTTILDTEDIFKFNGYVAELRVNFFNEETMIKFLQMCRNEEINGNAKRRVVRFDNAVSIHEIVVELKNPYMIHYGLQSRIFADGQCFFKCQTKNGRIMTVTIDPTRELEVSFSTE